MPILSLLFNQEFLRELSCLTAGQEGGTKRCPNGEGHEAIIKEEGHVEKSNYGKFGNVCVVRIRRHD